MDEYELYDGRHSGPEIDAILDEAQASLPAIESSIAIVANGNTAPQNITAGQYVYVKNHSSLTEGLYYNKSGSTIASGTTLTSSNLGAVSNGGLNELKSALETKIEFINTTNFASNVNSSISFNQSYCIFTRCGNTVCFSLVFTVSSEIPAWMGLFTLDTSLRVKKDWRYVAIAPGLLVLVNDAFSLGGAALPAGTYAFSGTYQI